MALQVSEESGALAGLDKRAAVHDTDGLVAATCTGILVTVLPPCSSMHESSLQLISLQLMMTVDL